MKFLFQLIVFFTLSVLRFFASISSRYADVDVILIGAQLFRPCNTIFATPSSKSILGTVQIFTNFPSAFLLCFNQYFQSENRSACLRFVYNQ